MKNTFINPKYFIWLLVAVVLGAIVFGIWSVVDDVSNDDKFNQPATTTAVTSTE